MSLHASSLPDRWVQSLWTELRANYGARWDRQFPTPPCPPGTEPAAHAMAHVHGIQGVWAKRLGRFQTNPDAIRFALDHLPEDPPTLPQFESLCNRRPDRPQQSLPAPQANPERVQQALAGITRQREPIDRLAPLRQLHHWDVHNGGRMANGKLITLAQRATYRQALGLDSKVPNTNTQEA
jgi:hypothetical protein